MAKHFISSRYVNEMYVSMIISSMILFLTKPNKFCKDMGLGGGSGGSGLSIFNRIH